MKKIGQMIKKYGNTVLLFLAVFSASEIGNKGCMFIFHQPEIPEELQNYESAPEPYYRKN